MINHHKIQKYLTRLINSKEFSESERYQDLLKYLVEASIANETPKEVTIAHDVFNKSVDFDSKNNTQVRVYIHNLRKKLDSYYQHEGKDDDLIFEIPKGHYKVVFNSCKSEPNRFTKKSIIIVNGFILLLLLLANLVFFNRNQLNEINYITKDVSVWSEFLSDETPVLIVIGDYYLYRIEDLFDNESHFYVRDYTINTDTDLENFVQEIESKSEIVKKTNHTLLGKYAPVAISELTKLLFAHSKEFDIKLSSSFQFQDMEKYNIIFVGTFKSFGIINDLITPLNFSYKVKPNTLYYSVNDTTFSYVSTSSTVDNAYEDDYSMVAKIPISAENAMMVFSSTRDIGCIATVKHLTNPNTLNHFEKEHNITESTNHFFQSVFKIQGFERNVNSVEILHFDPVILD